MTNDYKQKAERLTMRVGRRIKETQILMRVSQQELSKTLGLPLRTLQGLIAGRCKSITLANLLRVADKLNLKIEALIP